VMTKAIAVVFLGLTLLVTRDAPWVVPLSAAGDFAMGLAVVALRRARRLPLAGGVCS